MGLSGSTHLKIGNECYNTEKEYLSSYKFSNITLLPLTVIFIGVNFSLKFKNKIALGLLILIGLYIVYVNTIGPYLEKKSFVKQYGKKVDCPKPDPNCNDKYIQYLIDQRIKTSFPVYTCDDRLKYN